MDILHPLATLHWGEQKCGDLPECIDDPHCVYLNGYIFVGGGITESEERAKLFVCPADLSAWSVLTTPTQQFALTTYRSQLVLVGGIETSSKLVTNQLYSTDTANIDWKPFTSMPTKRFSLSAANTGNPEYLVMAGGVNADYRMVDTVEVFADEQWVTVQHLPLKCYYMKSTLHNGKLYLVGGEFHAGGGEISIGYSCDVKSLLVSGGSLWSQFEAPFPHACVASFGGRLIKIGGCELVSLGSGYSHSIFAHSPFSNSDVHVGSIPAVRKLIGGCAIVLPTGELVVLGGWRVAKHRTQVYKASLKSKQ